MTWTKIKVHGNSFLNEYKITKAQKEYVCHATNCYDPIRKREENYVISTHPGTAHVHLHCAEVYCYRERDIAHEYSAFPKIIGEWLPYTKEVVA